MMSLFSSFDLSYHTQLIFYCLLILSMLFKLIYMPLKMKMFMNYMIKELMFFFYSLKNKNFQKTWMMVLIMMFLSILSMNFVSITPYIFPLTSQISLVMFMASIIWVSIMSFYTFKNYSMMISHFTPNGTPYLLVPFLFLIEIISNLIRPMTVSVRLVANILAGHLLMILLSKLIMMNLSLTMFYVSLNLVEMAVALIQSYIFCTMMALYYSEIN